MEPPRPFNTWIFIPSNVVGPEVERPVADLPEGGGRRATAPADRPVAEAAIRGLYELVDVPPPRLVWIDSPRGDSLERQLVPPWSRGAAIAAAHGVPEPGEFLLNRLRDWDGERGGRFSRGRRRERRERRELWGRRLALWKDLLESCGGWWPFEDVCLVCERPAEMHVVPASKFETVHWQLHCRKGPAVRYRDGFHLYALHGRVVPADAVVGEQTGTGRPAGLPDDLAELIEDSSAEEMARLVGKDFRGADLRGVRFPTGADLRDADLSGADLRYADLSGADAGVTAFMGAHLAGAKLVGADLRETDFGVVVGFTGADLTDADLSGAYFAGGAPVDGSCLDHAKLVRTKFVGANLNNAAFEGSDLTGADFTDADLSYVSGRISPDGVIFFFAGCTWDATTKWPNEEWAEAVREMSDPIDQGAFRVRKKSPTPVARKEPEPEPPTPSLAEYYFDPGH